MCLAVCELCECVGGMRVGGLAGAGVIVPVPVSSVHFLPPEIAYVIVCLCLCPLSPQGEKEL